jgi:hypothetical protein
MKKKISILAVLAVLAIAVALPAGEGKKGEKLVSGTISSLDTSARTLTVSDAKGASWTVQWTDSTRVMGGELKEGAAVQLGCTESDNKHWANWIKVAEAKQ